MRTVILLVVILGVLLSGCGNELVACTEDAKICSDGSVLVREGVDCTFPDCPDEHTCLDAEREVDACPEIYQPVCGWFNEEVKCVTYPCAATYSNGCFACQNEEVKRWTEGECPEIR